MGAGPVVEVAPGVTIGRGEALLVVAGPCVIESLDLCREAAEALVAICSRLGLSCVFKASFDKANRTSVSSFRGPGLEAGLDILAAVREEFSVPVLTDIHEPGQAAEAAEVADVLQIPAFLCRQTDLLLAAGRTGRAVSIKKGQFLAPEDMRPAVDKVRSTGNERVMVTERGTAFGYRNLVVDMRSLAILSGQGAPVVFDCTHSVQLPGGLGGASGGQRQFVAPLARAAAGVGINGLFLEVHPDPASALCDGANSLALSEIEPLLRSVKQIHECVG